MKTFDIESYDPELESIGPGVYRKDGFVLGVSIKKDAEPSHYYSFKHPDTSAYEEEKNRAIVAAELGDNEDKLAANCQYDMDWLENYEEIKVNGFIHDVQIAEPLLNEYRTSYSVNTLATIYEIETKRNQRIQEWATAHGYTDKAIKHIKEMPSALVGEYSEHDTDMEYAILQKQLVLLENQKLMDLYRMECGLTPLLLKMRKTGIRIDVNKRNEISALFRQRFSQLRAELFTEYGMFNHNSTRDLKEKFEELGIEYGRTERGAPSITKVELERSDHPFAKKVLALREVDKVYNAFTMGAFLEHEINGRIHCSFYQLKRDDGGTVSGRFSSQNPNLQQVPGKDESEKGAFDFGHMVRSIFIPEEGCLYGKIDYSQIEYRVIAHYARGSGAEEIKQRYNNDPNTDYHQFVMDKAKEYGHELTRGNAKRLNFGSAYFMGSAAMSRKFNWTMEEAESFMAMYNKSMPFIKPTRSAVVDVAKGRGYILTILGRRARVSDEIRQNHREYVMFNRLVQGSAADIMKKGMHDAYYAGLFDVLTPHITVHDELGLSIPKTKEGIEAYKELKHVMETCVKLRVPIIADAEIGPSWGETIELKEDKEWDSILS
jgi:DNA polymerase I-like protein with 3'-5' exonuclease and polymerase domains